MCVVCAGDGGTLGVAYGNSMCTGDGSLVDPLKLISGGHRSARKPLETAKFPPPCVDSDGSPRKCTVSFVPQERGALSRGQESSLLCKENASSDSIALPLPQHGCTRLCAEIYPTTLANALETAGIECLIWMATDMIKEADISNKGFITREEFRRAIFRASHLSRMVKGITYRWKHDTSYEQTPNSSVFTNVDTDHDVNRYISTNVSRTRASPIMNPSSFESKKLQTCVLVTMVPLLPQVHLFKDCLVGEAVQLRHTPPKTPHRITYVVRVASSKR